MDRIIKRATTLILLQILAGCASFAGNPSAVILQNIATGEFVTCEVDKWRTVESYKRNEQCVEDYKKQGYTVWAER
jgi:hypothetical protein